MRYREYRCPCDHPVSMSLPDGRRVAGVVVNISPEGARLARIDGLSAGDMLQSDFGSGCPPRDAQVRWVHGGYAGVRFGQRMDARTMAVVRKSVSHPGQTRPPVRAHSFREMR